MPSTVNYFWINADPKIWKMTDISVGETQYYSQINERNTPAKKQECFKNAKLGDKVIGYQSGNTGKIVALFDISQELENGKIGITKTETLDKPIAYSDLKTRGFTKSINGTLIDLSEEEYNLLINIIREENPEKNSKNENSNNLLKDKYEEYSKLLKESKNIILRGAPGTGKTHLAKEIAAIITSNGKTDKYDEANEQIEFVQFHPSYDYTDFVEGLRPSYNKDGSIGFKLVDGVFKSFVDKARLYSKKKTSKAILESFLEGVELEKSKFKLKRKGDFVIQSYNGKQIILKRSNSKTPIIKIDVNELCNLIESNIDFKKVDDITKYFGKPNQDRDYSYEFALYHEIKKQGLLDKTENPKFFVFIIDEINRGEISKIFGELFYSIDPDYRGKGVVKTKYSNMHLNPADMFYIPENVYVIGTMNDIDRSVDSFDFAMRRRFRFIEIEPEKTQAAILDSLDNQKRVDAKNRMDALNKAIRECQDLNENYQIGAAYFRKLEYLSPDELWEDYLCPLLQDYVRGLSDEKEQLYKFEVAFGYNT